MQLNLSFVFKNCTIWKEQEAHISHRSPEQQFLYHFRKYLKMKIFLTFVQLLKNTHIPRFENS